MSGDDLRAPLQVIAMTCNVIAMDKSEPLPPKFSDHLDRAQRSVDYMTQLVNDLLAVAHDPLRRQRPPPS